MASRTSTQNLSTLTINKVESQTAYDQMVNAGQINENELYLVEGDIVPSPYTSNPTMNGVASPGSSTSYAKGDHVHPSDTSRAPVSHATSTSTYGAGTGTNYGHLRLSDSTSSTSGTSGGTAATPSAVKAAYDLASGKANVYSMTFTTYNWSSQKITLNASTHGCGTAPMVQVQRLNGTSYEIYYGYPSTGWKVAIDSSGNITLSVPASGDEFAGRLVIR